MDFERFDKIRDMCAELEEYAELSNDEGGETWALLARFASYSDYVSEEFAEAWAKEVEAQLTMLKERTKIVEREEKITRTVRELEWDS